MELSLFGEDKVWLFFLKTADDKVMKEEKKNIICMQTYMIFEWPFGLEFNFGQFVCILNICDMIKRNKLDVGNVVFEILAETVFKFLCFILFLAL